MKKYLDEELKRMVLKSRKTKDEWAILYTQEDGLEIYHKPTNTAYSLTNSQAKTLYENGIQAIVAFYSIKEVESLSYTAKDQSWDFVAGVICFRRLQGKVTRLR